MNPDLLSNSTQFDIQQYPAIDRRSQAELLLDTAILQAEYQKSLEAKTLAFYPMITERK